MGLDRLVQRGLGNRRDMMDSRGSVDEMSSEDYVSLCPDDGSAVRRRWLLLERVYEVHVVGLLDRMCATGSQ
jgi:hypothetical protein